MPAEPLLPKATALQKIKEAYDGGMLLPPSEQISNVPDARYMAEKLDLEAQHVRAQLNSLTQDTEQRKTYANRTFYLVLSWLAAIAVMLFLQGFRFRDFSLDRGVLMVLIGSTTTGVVGLFYIVTRYLFPVREEKNTSNLPSVSARSRRSQKTKPT